jgi:ubiquinone/menaquinone biosynthesis C-methylase UbiE
VKATEQCILKNCSSKVLDIGCGTGRYAHLFTSDYYGIDINTKYLVNRPGKGRQFVACNAVDLPFKKNSFNSIFSVGFFHHVDSASSKKVYREMIRVCKPRSTVLIIDAFFPESSFDIAGHLLMKMDRGKFVRKKNPYMQELRNYFDIVHSHPISKSYPYTLFSFILQTR